MGMTRERCAELLSRGLARALVAAGLPPFAVTTAMVREWLLEPELGIGVQCRSSTGTAPTAPTAATSQAAEGTPEAAQGAAVNSRATAEAHCEERSTDSETLARWADVWRYWLELLGKDPATECEPKARSKIVDRLAAGFTPAELQEALQRAHLQPALVQRKRLLSPARPLQSDEQVCRLLGRPYKRAARTWLTPFEDAWQAEYGAGSLEYGAFAKYAARLVGELGGPAVLEEFKAYLRQTPIEYVSWSKFASGCGAEGGWRTRPGRASKRASAGLDNVW
jgi:hypothetical protein